MHNGPCFVSAALVASLVSCATQPAVDVEAARASLRDADTQYSQAGTSQNKEIFLAFYAPESVMYPPGGAAVTGLEAIGRFLDAALGDTAFAITFRPLAVEVSGDGTMGYTLNTAALTLTGPDGKPMTEQIRDFHLWRRQQDGSWKLLIDIWNAEPASTGAGND